MHSVKFGTRKLFPSKIVCIGRNYVEHIEELGNELPENIVIFNKPNSAVTDTLRYFGPEVRFEGEICLLIEKGEIAGVGFGLDLTHAALQNRLKAKGLPWEHAKAFDGAAVLSDFVPFDRDLSRIRFTLARNRTVVQHADYDLMITKPEELLREAQSFMTLEDGDVIMTGTPKGVNTYAPEDRFEATVFDGSKELLHTEWICR